MKKSSKRVTLKVLSAILAVNLLTMEPVTAFAGEGDLENQDISRDSELLEEELTEASEEYSKEDEDYFSEEDAFSEEEQEVLTEDGEFEELLEESEDEDFDSKASLSDNDAASLEGTIDAKQSYTISFVTNCSTDINDIAVPEGTQIAAVVEWADKKLEEQGKEIAHWYGDEDFNDYLIYERYIISDMTIYAKWEDTDLAPNGSKAAVNGSGISVTGIQDTIRYTGKPIKFSDIVVKDADKVLRRGKDYTVKYQNNTKVSTDKKKAYVIITFKGAYKGVKKIPFTIIKGWICPKTTKSETILLSYNGKVRKAKPVLYHGTGKDRMKLKLNKDYTLEYVSFGDGDFKEPGTYYIVVTGKGNYEGMTYVEEIITKNRLVRNLTVNKVKQQTCKRGMTRPGLVVKDGKKVLTEGTHYYTEYKNWDSVGTATVVIRGIESGGYMGEKTITYKVVAQNLSKAKVKGIQKRKFNGQAQTQENIEVYIPGTKKVQKKVLKGIDASRYAGLSAGEKKNYDYTISYKNNVKAGKATVIIKGVGCYRGTIKKTFTITR